MSRSRIARVHRAAEAVRAPLDREYSVAPYERLVEISRRLERIELRRARAIVMAYRLDVSAHLYLRRRRAA